MLSFKDTQTIILSFISLWLDHCNGLLTGVIQKSINRLQVVQNVAAREERTHDSDFNDLTHWLPICFGIDFKILLITFKAFHGLASEYISELLPSHPT